MVEESSSPEVTPPDTGNGVDRRLLFLAFFFAAFLYLLYQFIRIMSPFLAPLVGALMLTLIFYPLHRWVTHFLKRPNLASAASTVVVLVTIVVPVYVLAWLLVSEARDIAPATREWLTMRGEPGILSRMSLPAPLEELRQHVQQYLDRWNVDLRSIAIDALRDMGNTVTSFGAATLKQIFALLLDLIVLLCALFFFFRDGERFVTWSLELVPMEAENKELILERLDRTLSAIIRGAFITATVQGALTGLGLGVAGVPFPVLLGFAAAILSVVPFIGASLIWAPAGIYLLVSGEIAAGIGLLVWGALVVGLVDNFMRPYLVGERARLPVLLLLVGILGGIQVYGLVGALVAPLVIASVLAFANIYRDQYLPGRGPALTPPTD